MLINFKKENGKRTSIRLSDLDLAMFSYCIGFYAGNDFDENNVEHVDFLKNKIYKKIDNYEMGDFTINILRAHMIGALSEMVKPHHTQFDNHAEDFKLEMEQDGLIKK